MKKAILTAAIFAITGFAFATPAAAQSHFLRGDCNFDGSVSLTDAIFELQYLFSAGAVPICLDACDTNDNGATNLADAVAILQYLFAAGANPAAPFPTFEKDPTDEDGISCKPNIVVLAGDILADTALELENTYRLESGVFVKDGVTMTIEAGVTVLGDTATEGLLVIERGGDIEATGTALLPVVFTSDKAVGARGRGDWGGLIILGNGTVNEAGGFAEAEGLSGQTYGGGLTPDDTESSGSMYYVRIEFGGTEISTDNEVNGLSLFAVGSGSNFDHIMVKYNLDDGVEWFGGKCDLRYGLTVGIGDDCFDYSFGWTGNAQFLVGQQRGDDADKGFEVDNHETVFGSLPLTLPTLSNITLVGDPAGTVASDQSVIGIHLRRGAGSRIYNAIVTGFNNGFDIDDAVTTAHNPANGELILDYCAFYGNDESYETGDSEPAPAFAFTTTEFATVQNINNTSTTDALITNPYDLVAPDFTPNTGLIPDELDPTTLGAFFDDADFIGGVDPDSDWTQSQWISYQQN